MNTDNTTISGETIDYGPCAFMDAYDPATVFSSIDQDGRYAYGNQPAIIFWNLARLAETLLGLIDADADRAVARAGAVIADLQRGYRQEWLQVFARKLGIAPDAEDVIDGLDGLLAGEGVDFTQFFCALSAVLQGDESRLRGLFKTPARLDNWLASWRGHVEDVGAALGVMRTVNPIYIPRNHLVEEALNAASDKGDLGLFNTLLARVQAPFTLVEKAEQYAAPAPPGSARIVTYCGT